MNKNMSKGSQIAIIIGLALVGYGLFSIFQFALGPVWSIISGIWRVVAAVTWPVLIIAVGGLIIYKGKNGGLDKLTFAGRKLYRSQTDKWVSGVLGGLAEYVGVDSLWVRVLYIIFMLASFGWAIIIYFILAAVIPENPYISNK